MEKRKDSLRTTLIIFALVIATLIVWHAANVFLLAFAAILLAILLHGMGVWTHKFTRLPYPIALIASVIIVLGAMAAIFWLYTPLITTQFQQLAEELPEAFNNLKETVKNNFNLQFFSEEALKKELIASGQKILSQLTFIFSFTFGSITSFIIFILVGFYLAIQPALYRKGFLMMFRSNREYMAGLLDKVTHTLRWWVLGKMIAMVIIGILSYIGLLLLDVSLAFILGLLAGLLTFVPYIGPIAASIPAILLAFTNGPLTALYVVLLYLGIHALEGYFITPYIEQKTVLMPPALTIMTQILMAVLFGFLGLALAPPLFAVCISFFQYHYQSDRKKLKV